MKARLLLLCCLASVTSASQAAALRQAEVTRVVNDVKILPPQQKPVTAKIGDTVRGPSAVSTGAQSRAELRFQDNTITRLGSNSIFTLDEASRTVDLEKGTILLQVPKKIGGVPTRIRTAAVTAAITGTTVMVEYLPGGHIKIIVLEGEVDVYLTDDPGTFRTIRPGDMIIMQADAKDIPEPVQVDLKRLKETSKLTSNENFQALGNERHLNRAELNQQNLKDKGELHDTRLVIVGTGTDVTIDGKFGIRDLLGGGPGGGTGGNNPNDPGGGTGGPGGGTGPGTTSLRGPLLSGATVIDDDSFFSPGPPPTVFANFNGTYGTGRGGVYRPSQDGGVGSFFGRASNRRPDGSSFDQAMRNAGNWTEYRFQSLDIIGQSGVGEIRQGERDSIPSGIPNLLLSSNTNITLSDTNPLNNAQASGYWNLNIPAYEKLALLARNTITWNSSFLLVGFGQEVLLYTQGDPQAEAAAEPITDETLALPGIGDIAFDGGSGNALIDIGEGSLDVLAGRDLILSGTSTSPSNTLAADTVSLAAKRDVRMSNASVGASSSLKVQAGRNLRIGSSTTLRRLASMDPLQIELLAQQGNLDINGGIPGGADISGQSVSLTANVGNISIYNASLSADHLRAITYGPNGALMIGNSTLTGTLGIKLYAEGSNGSVQFVGPTTLNGPTTIAGKLVQVNNGVNVTVTNPAQLQIHGDTHNYNNITHGNFTDGTNNITFTPGGNQKPFATRPAF
jgi:hypothetical protein